MSKLKIFEEFALLVFFILLLTSSFFAISYLNNSDVFSAKLSYVNDQKLPYYVIFQINNKKPETLDFDVELIFKKGNLVVDSKKISCRDNCEEKLEIKRIFFDEYYLVIRTRYDNKIYEKKLEFELKMPESKNKLILDKKEYILKNLTSINITGKIQVQNPSKVVLETFSKKNPDLKIKKEIYCENECNFGLEINSNILFEKYQFNAYFPTDAKSQDYTISLFSNQTNNNENNLNNSNQINNSLLNLTNYLDFNLSKKYFYNKKFKDGEEEEKYFSKLVENFCYNDKKYNTKNQEDMFNCFTKNNFIDTNNIIISNFPNNVTLGDKINFTLIIIGYNIKSSDLNLAKNFKIKSQRFENQSTIFEIFGKIVNNKDEFYISDKLKRFKKIIELEVEKSQRIKDIENNIGLRVEEVEEKNNSRDDIVFTKINSKVKFNNANTQNIQKIDFVKKRDLKGFKENEKQEIKTDVITVDATDFSNATVILQKNSPENIEKILTCNNFVNNKCLSNWVDSNLDFNQNESFVWFTTTHFSAYLGVGAGYTFSVNFTNPNKQIIYQNNISSVDVNVSCFGGNCGTLNVTLYYHVSNSLENLETGFGSWSADGGSCTWIRNQDITPSRSTGPGGNSAGTGFDHTLGTNTGWYSYVETSGSVCQGGDLQAILTGTSLSGTQEAINLSFWYHMYGANIGTLHLDVLDGASWTNDVWTVSGQQNTQNPPYLNAVVDLSKYTNTKNVRLRYNGVTGWRADIAIDDFYIATASKIQGTSNTPLWINNSNIQQVTLNSGQSQIVKFDINASGTPGQIVDIFAVAYSSSNKDIRGQSVNKSIEIRESQKPTGNKISPINSTTSNTRTVTFNANIQDNIQLSTATLYIWDLEDNLIYSKTKAVSGVSTGVSFNYDFPINGNYKWNILVKDTSDNTYWLDGGVKWYINLDFPGLGIGFNNLPSTFYVIKDTTKNLTLDVSCKGQNCGLVNVSLYYYTLANNLEDLETGFGNWNIDGGSCTWIRNQDITPSRSTGPGGNSAGTGFDHTLGTNTGWYSYVETSGSVCQGADTSAIITGTQIPADFSIDYVSFWYHLYGANMGTLHFDVFDGASWTNDVWMISGQQNSQNPPYINAQIDLSSYPNTLNTRLRYDGVGGWQADAAIDDLYFEYSGYILIPSSSQLPMWIENTNLKQITLNDGDTATVSFNLTPTDSVGKSYLIIAKANSNLNPALNTQSTVKNLTIVNHLDLNVTKIEIKPTIEDAGDFTKITCKVQESATTQAIDNFLVSFSSNRTGLIGSSYTDNLGYSSLIYSIPQTPSVGDFFENVTCSITSDIPRAYLASSQNSQSDLLEVLEFAPWQTNWDMTGGDGSVFLRGDYLDVWAYWHDNFYLDYTKLEHNGTGIFTNYTKYFNHTKDLILDYNFESVSTNKVFDSSSYNYDGNFINGTTYDDKNNLKGNYGFFDGTNDYIDSGDIGEIDGAIELSASVWVKLNDLNSDLNILSKDIHGSNSQVLFWRDDVGSNSGRTNIFSILVSDGSSDTRIEGATGSANDNTWHHVAFTFKANDINGLRLFIDGIEDANSPVSTIGINQLKSTSNSLLIGRPIGGTQYFNGYIDEIKIFNKTLTDIEVYNLFDINNDNYFQNYSLDLTSATDFPKVGPIQIKAMHAFDNFGWSSSTSSPLSFTLYGFADITELLPFPAAVRNWGDNSLVYCQVKDNYTNLPIQNYPVNFYSNVTGFEGTNLTDSEGKAYITINIPETKNVTCNITNQLGIYYYTNIDEKSQIITRDNIYPTWSNWDIKYQAGGSVANGANINKTQNIYAHSLWQDNYELYYAYITHNGAGSSQNFNINPFPTINGANTSWANYTFDFTNFTQFSGVGLITVTGISGSDKSENINTTTPSKFFYLYGFANATSISANNTYYANNTQISIYCNITDNTSNGPINNFNVSLYSNQTGFINSSLTNAQGIATFTYTDTTPSYETLTCNISPKGYYYIDSNNVSMQVFNDNIPPYIISDYNVTPIKVHPNEDTTIHAKWSESINSSTIKTDYGNFPVLNYADNWTNGTITTDISWAKGPNNVSFINTYDQYGNVNLTSENISLLLYRYANITSIVLSPDTIYVGDNTTFGCKVTDFINSNPVSGINVSFYVNSGYVNSSYTNSLGWAYLNYSPSVGGSYLVSCDFNTNDINYYDPTYDSAASIDLSVLSLNGRACSADTLSVSYNEYFDSVLDDGFELREGSNCDATNNNYVSWFTKVNSRADSYGGYNNGPVDSTSTHSNGILDAGPNLRLECRSGGRTPSESYTHLYENIDPESLIGFKVLFYYADRLGRELSTASSPNWITTIAYNTNQDTTSSTDYMQTIFSPTTSACTGESATDGTGDTAYYQEVNLYSIIPILKNTGLSTIDIRFALYTQFNYAFTNIRNEFNYNEFELYTKQLSVDMIEPASNIESYPNKTQTIKCSVPTLGANTSNVDLYPQYCSGASCSSFTNLQTATGPIRVTSATYACSDSTCENTFTIDYSEEGIYKLRCNATNFNSYSIGSSSVDYIVNVANLNLTNLSYDKNELNQYEIGDKIKSVNISIFNDNRGIAYNSNITFNILNSSAQKPTWLPTLPKIKYCSPTLNKNSYCNTSYDNSGIGYSIPLTANNGHYNFSVIYDWLNNGGPITNNSFGFDILDLRNTFSSYAQNYSILKGTNTQVYFNMTNLFNQNLTNINISINCPSGITCVGNNGKSNIYSQLSNNTLLNSNFSIITNSSTISKDYDFTFNIIYTNPRGYTKTWTNKNLVTVNVFLFGEYTNRSLKINKTITNIGQNIYRVNINIENLADITSNVTFIDFVDSAFSASSFSTSYNFTNNIVSSKYNGDIYGWNFTLLNYDSFNLNYTINGSGNYNLLNNYVYGLE